MPDSYSSLLYCGKYVSSMFIACGGTDINLFRVVDLRSHAVSIHTHAQISRLLAILYMYTYICMYVYTREGGGVVTRTMMTTIVSSADVGDDQEFTRWHVQFGRRSGESEAREENSVPQHCVAARVLRWQKDIRDRRSTRLISNSNQRLKTLFSWIKSSLIPFLIRMSSFGCLD